MTLFDTIFINRKDPEGRRHFDLAHELFHVLTWDRLPPRRIDSYRPTGSRDKRIERLADNFAGALLMPAKEFGHQWRIRQGLEIHDRLNDVANRFLVTASAAKVRCQVLDIITTADAVGINDDLLRWNGRPAEQQLPESLFSRRFVERIQWALDHFGALSVRRAAGVLGLTIDELADLFRQYRIPAPFEF